jgi:hypothetical protein
MLRENLFSFIIFFSIWILIVYIIVYQHHHEPDPISASSLGSNGNFKGGNSANEGVPGGYKLSKLLQDREKTRLDQIIDFKTPSSAENQPLIKSKPTLTKAISNLQQKETNQLRPKDFKKETDSSPKIDLSPIKESAETKEHKEVNMKKESDHSNSNSRFNGVQSSPVATVHLKKTVADYKTEGISSSWSEFAFKPHAPLHRSNPWPKTPANLRVCPKEVEDKLNERLDKEKLNWCQWALSNSGGNVKVIPCLFIKSQIAISLRWWLHSYLTVWH